MIFFMRKIRKGINSKEEHLPSRILQNNESLSGNEK